MFKLMSWIFVSSILFSANADSASLTSDQLNEVKAAVKDLCETADSGKRVEVKVKPSGNILFRFFQAGVEGEVSKEEWTAPDPKDGSQEARIKCAVDMMGMLLPKLVRTGDADERKKAEEMEKRKILVQNCITTKTAEYESPISKSVGLGTRARARSPGIWGGRKTSTRNVCFVGGPEQVVVSAQVAGPIACNKNMCSASPPKYTDNNQKVCIVVKAWSESKSWGAGGWAEYRLDVSYKNVATTSVLKNITAECEASVP